MRNKLKIFVLNIFKIIILFSNSILKKLTSINYSVLWKIYSLSNSRELSFDHEIDIFYRWPKIGTFNWGKIGGINSELISYFSYPNVLELGCSDGFYACYFYRYISNCKYIGLDLDDKRLEIARKRIKNNDFIFLHKDFLEELPNYNFTNVLWNESINMFSNEQQEIILSNIKNRLSFHKGILSGTGVLLREAEIQWNYYCGLWKSVEEAYNILKKYFDYVFVYTREEMSGIAVFFIASDKRLPMGDGYWNIKKNDSDIK